MEAAKNCSTAIGQRRLVELIRRISSGDDRAFSELHALTIYKMRKTALSVGSPPADTEDILQEAYLKIWRHSSRFDPSRASPITWMTTITRNTAIDAVRPARLPTMELEQKFLIADGTDQSEDDFDDDRAWLIAATIIASLPGDRQTLLSLAYLDGESRKELAARFGVSVNTIKTWLRRTLVSVRAECLLT
jgi:RNA polymerase sigma-70 factor (ECF subfamily)